MPANVNNIASADRRISTSRAVPAVRNSVSPHWTQHKQMYAGIPTCMKSYFCKSYSAFRSPPNVEPDEESIMHVALSNLRLEQPEKVES